MKLAGLPVDQKPWTVDDLERVCAYHRPSVKRARDYRRARRGRFGLLRRRLYCLLSGDLS